MRVDNEEVKREIGFLILRAAHALFLVVALGVISLFVYENNVQTLDSYADISIVVPSKTEFEGDEQIKTIVFADVSDKTNIGIKHQLMCDFGDGDGYGIVSHDAVSFTATPSPQDFSEIKILADNANGPLSTTQISKRLRHLNLNKNIGNLVVFSGNLPVSTAQCFFEVELDVHTKFFNIGKHFEVVSYPFDYVWYYTPSQNIFGIKIPD